jgi:prepilin-type N-terminal cleavage/methylation domain-containing protein
MIFVRTRNQADTWACLRRDSDVPTLDAMRDRESGFTLLEIMITLSVVAILSVIALPSFFGETRKSKSSAEVQPLFSDVRVRLEEYLQEHGHYPPTVGEGTWNPTTAPGTTRVALDLAAPGWLPLHVRPSAELEVYCRYTFATGLATDGTNIGTEAATRFGFTAPATDWYYLLAKCDMDGDPTALSWYFASSVDSAIKRQAEGN